MHVQRIKFRYDFGEIESYMLSGIKTIQTRKMERTRWEMEIKSFVFYNAKQFAHMRLINFQNVHAHV